MARHKSSMDDLKVGFANNSWMLVQISMNAFCIKKRSPAFNTSRRYEGFTAIIELGIDFNKDFHKEWLWPQSQVDEPTRQIDILHVD